MMLLALAFLLVHTFVPHHHHSNLTSQENFQEHQSAKSLMDYIALSYHSQGDHDLEEFTVANQLAIEFNADFVQQIATIASFYLILVEQEAKTNTFANPNVNLQEAWNTTQTLRGPPTIIA